MVHARLNAGGENAGKLVARVKNDAKRLAKKMHKKYILVDGAPGIGCPVVSALSGADFVLFVAEPTISGLHDLKRIAELVKRFRLRSGCIINKFDLNEDLTCDIKRFINAEDIMHIADIPFDDTFTMAMIHGKTIMEYKPNPVQEILLQSWDKIRLVFNKEGSLK